MQHTHKTSWVSGLNTKIEMQNQTLMHFDGYTLFIRALQLCDISDAYLELKFVFYIFKKNGTLGNA